MQAIQYRDQASFEQEMETRGLGYLLIPSIPEEHLATEVQNLKAVIEKNALKIVGLCV